MTEEMLQKFISKYNIKLDMRSNNHFDGLIPYVKDNYITEARILKVTYSQSTTTVFWDDNTETVAKKDDEDYYNSKVGLLVCILKKISGAQEVSSILRDWYVPNKEVEYGYKPVVRTIADIREERKEHTTV